MAEAGGMNACGGRRRRPRVRGRSERGAERSAAARASRRRRPAPPAHRLPRPAGGRRSSIETGLGDFSFDWMLVQDRVARTRRICTYDRAGYAWSEPGPKPRTFDQLNLELHEATGGGGRARAVHPGRPLVRRRGGAQLRAALPVGDRRAGRSPRRSATRNTSRWGRGAATARASPPAAHSPSRDATCGPADAPTGQGYGAHGAYEEDPVLAPCRRRCARWHRWATLLPALEDAENSQRDWSVENIARWAAPT